MIKKLLAILSIVVLPFCAAAQNYVTISGKINNLKSNDCIVINRPGYLGVLGPFNDTIKVDEQGYFADTIKNVNQATFANWSLIGTKDFLNKKLSLFLFPGYNLYITADSQKGIYNTVKYGNCGAVANNYLAQHDRKFVFTPADFYTAHKLEEVKELKEKETHQNKNIDILDLNYTQAVMMQEVNFEDSLKRYYEQQKIFLKDFFRTNLDQSDNTIRFFAALEYIDMDYSVAEALLRFPSQNVIYSHSVQLSPSTINVDFYNNLAKNQLEHKDEYIPSPSYRLFVSDFVNLVTGELESSFTINPKIATYTERFDATLGLYHGLTRDYVLGSILREELKKANKGEADREESKMLFKRFKDLNPNDEILKSISKLYQQTNLDSK